MECPYKQSECFANSAQNLCYVLVKKPNHDYCPFFKTVEEAGGTAQELEQKAHAYSLTRGAK